MSSGALLKAAMLVLIGVALLVALLCEWSGLIGVAQPLGFSLLALLRYFATLRHARYRQRLTRILQPALRLESPAS